MLRWFIRLMMLMIMLAGVITAQSKNSIVGTWKLIALIERTDKGEILRSPTSAPPAGFITYTADGRIMSIYTDGGRKLLSVPDRVSAPAAERAEAFSTVMAYAGSYHFTGDKVVHHIEVASLQNYVNTDLVRFATIRGNRLTLHTTPLLKGGQEITQEAVFERLTPGSNIH